MNLGEGETKGIQIEKEQPSQTEEQPEQLVEEE